MKTKVFALPLVFFFTNFSYNSFGQQDPGEMAKKMIEQKDLDGDGALCFMECPSELSYDFKKLDLNADNFLSLEEITAHLMPKSESKKTK